MHCLSTSPVASDGSAGIAVALYAPDCDIFALRRSEVDTKGSRLSLCVQAIAVLALQGPP